MNRPQIRNIGLGDIRHYRLPLPGLVSILHRVSGLLLFLSLPLLLWLLDLSLSSERSYDALVNFARNGVVRLVLLALAWALLHHVCAGVRFLLLDLHWGTERAMARRTSIGVLAVSLALTLVAAGFLWGGR